MRGALLASIVLEPLLDALSGMGCIHIGFDRWSSSTDGRAVTFILDWKPGISLDCMPSCASYTPYMSNIKALTSNSAINDPSGLNASPFSSNLGPGRWMHVCRHTAENQLRCHLVRWKSKAAQQ